MPAYRVHIWGTFVHGWAFGAPGHLRFSYATSSALIEEGLDRLQGALGG